MNLRKKEETSQPVFKQQVTYVLSNRWKLLKIEAESAGDIVSHLLVKQHSRFDSWRCQDRRKARKEGAREWRSNAEHEPERVRRVGLQYNQH